MLHLSDQEETLEVMYVDADDDMFHNIYCVDCGASTGNGTSEQLQTLAEARAALSDALEEASVITAIRP